MSKSQFELLSKYLSDVSKGILLAVVVGLGTGQLGWLFALLDIALAVYCLIAALWLEDLKNDAK